MSKFVEGTRFHILIPLFLDESFSSIDQIAKQVTTLGFVRFQIGENNYSVADTVHAAVSPEEKIYIIVDRLIKKIDESFDTRLIDSVRIAFEK